MVWKVWLGGYMTIWLCCIMFSMSSCSESVPSRHVTAYCMFLCFSLQNTNMTLWSHMLYALGSALPCTRTLKVSGTITWEWWVGVCSVLEGQKTFLGGLSCLGPLSCNYDTQNWCYRVGLAPAEKKGSWLNHVACTMPLFRAWIYIYPYHPRDCDSHRCTVSMISNAMQS